MGTMCDLNNHLTQMSQQIAFKKIQIKDKSVTKVFVLSIFYIFNLFEIQQLVSLRTSIF